MYNMRASSNTNWSLFFSLFTWWCNLHMKSCHIYGDSLDILTALIIKMLWQKWTNLLLLWLPVISCQSLLSAQSIIQLQSTTCLCLPTCRSVCLSTYLSVYLSVCLPSCPSTCLSFYLPVYLPTCLSAYPVRVRVECPSILVHDSSSRGQTCCWRVVWYGGVSRMDGGLKALSPSGLAGSSKCTTLASLMTIRRG